MPTIPTVNPNGGITTVACSGQQMGYIIKDANRDVRFSGLRVNQNEKWNQIGPMFVNSNNTWNPVNSVFINTNGEWKQSAPEIGEGAPRVDIRVNLQSVGEVCGDFGGNSYMGYTLRNGLYIPAGWRFKRIRFAARYDVICDGIFLAQSAALAASLGQVKQKALVLCRRSNPSYINAANTVGHCGVNSSVYQWSTAPFARTNLRNGQGGNMQAVRLISIGESTSGMCGGVGGGPVDLVALSIPPTYTLPFPIDSFVSVRFSSSCGGKRRYCNHYACGGCSENYLDFEEPIPPDVSPPD